MHSVPFVLCSAAAFTATTAFAQQVPATRTLARPTVEYAEPFSQIVGLRELRDGRVIVADSRDRTLQVVDLATGRATPISREGSGPLEWQSLSWLLPLPGDSTAMPDARNSRLLIIGPDARPARTFTPAAEQAMAVPGGGRMTISGGGIVSARFSDRQGRLYYADRGVSFGPGGLVRSDSAAVLRYDPRLQKTDTMTFLATRQLGPTGRSTQPAPAVGGGGSATVLTSTAAPFSPVHAWGVTPDGRVVLAYPSDYHVEIVQPGARRAVGPRVAYTPIRIGDAEKEQYIGRLRGQSGRAMMMINGVARPAPPPPEPTEWPEVMPPFPNATVNVAPTGEAWILRSRAARDNVPVYDVFNAEGRLTGRIALPANTSLAGFGTRGVYLVRTDDDGLQYLQLHALKWEG